MNNPVVSENDFKVIEEISKERRLTQRELSKRTNLSLGAVNIILKRLIGHGIVKTKDLNRKKVEYIVTPKGFSEKARKSYNYLFKTIDLVKQVREEIAKIVVDEFNKGQKKFIILGNDPLADIIELALKGFEYIRVEDAGRITEKDALLFAGEKKPVNYSGRWIDLSARLGEIYWGI